MNRLPAPARPPLVAALHTGALAKPPLRPAATIEIPADFALTVPLEVEATDATEDDTEGGAL